MLLMKGKVEKSEAGYMREVVRVGGCCASWWLWGLVAPGLGRLKPDTTGSSHRGRPASDFSTFPFISNIIYIPSLGVKVQSDAHYSSKKIISLYYVVLWH